MKSIRQRYLGFSIFASLVLILAAYLFFKTQLQKQLNVVKSQETKAAQNLADSISSEFELSIRELYLLEKVLTDGNNVNSSTKSLLQQILRPRLEGRMALLVNEKNIVESTFPRNKEIDGLNMETQSFVKEVRIRKTPVFASINSFAGEFANSVVVALPTNNDHILVQFLPNHVLAQIIDKHHKFATGFIAVLNEQGSVLSSTASDRSLIRRNFSNVPCVASTLIHSKPDACSAIFFQENGIAAAAPTRVAKLSVLMFQPSSGLLNFTYDLGILFWSLFAAVVGIFVLLAWFLWHQLFKPVHELTAKCALVAEGDLSQTAEARYVEFAPLMNGFTNMLVHVKERENDVGNALDAAKTASEAKSQFLANFGHEVRTPLTTMISVCELHRLGVITSEAIGEYFDMIESSSNHLLDLISQVISLTKTENGPLDIASTHFSISEIAHEVSAMILPRLKKSGVRFEAHISPSTPRILVSDPLRLRQILTNLLGNAAKFTERGTIQLKITTLGTSSDSIRIVRFTISDTGIGISASFQEKIFTPFTQEDDSTSKKFSGAGLGLAITKNIVENMRGTISCESKKGEGTTFIVEIPMRATPEQALGAQS